MSGQLKKIDGLTRDETKGTFVRKKRKRKRNEKKRKSSLWKVYKCELITAWEDSRNKRIRAEIK